MIISGHQPDLLPYSGFWYKMANSDIFDLKIYDQFVNKGYQRRVMMRNNWTSVPVVSGAGIGSYASIFDKLIDPVVAPKILADGVFGRYGGAPYWKQRGPQVMHMIEKLHTDRLWQFNFELILGIRDMLGIRTPISVGLPTVGKGSTGLISVLKLYGDGNTYLSGTGARVYMGDCAEFTEAGIDVIWSRHKAVTGDSILSVIFDYEEPMDIVLAEHDKQMENST